jgi:hypothetical protein
MRIVPRLLPNVQRQWCINMSHTIREDELGSNFYLKDCFVSQIESETKGAMF